MPDFFKQVYQADQRLCTQTSSISLCKKMFCEANMDGKKERDFCLSFVIWILRYPAM